MSIDITNLENFLFTEKKEDFLKKLVQGTEAFYFFSLNNALNSFGLDIPQDQLNLLEQFKIMDNQASRSVELRYLLLKLQNSKTDEDQKSLINKINQRFLSYQFTHSQPVKATGMSLASGMAVASNDSLDRELLSYSTILKVSDLEYKIHSVDEYLLSQLSTDDLKQAPYRTIESFFNKIKGSVSVMKGIPSLLQHFYEKEKRFPHEVTSYLTLKQMDEFVALVPNISLNNDFLIAYLMKTFKMDLKFIDRYSGIFASEKTSEKMKIIKQILEWARKLTYRRQNLEDKLIRTLLLLGLQNNDFDFDLFVQFLKEPTTNYSNISPQQANVYNIRTQKGRDNFEGEQIALLLGVKSTLTDQNIIDKFSIKYINLKENYDIILPYFNETYLKKILLKIQLLKGKSVEKITEHLNPTQIKDLTEKKYIKICQYNKKIFKANQDVKLDVVLKNVPQLSVKLFEFNTENYYKKNLKELDNQIELDGLIASEESSFEFTNPPIQKFIQSFKFDNISKKNKGVFIIDFMGNGVSSRAIIQKGCLVLREKKTVAGQAFQIIDENLEVCKGPKTGIFFQRKFYPINSDDEVIIPFTDSAITEQAILIHDDFSCITSITTLTESFQFHCAYLYNTQSMLMSSKGKVLIQPRIYFNNQPAPLSILKESKIVVTSVNQMGISSSTSFNKIEFNHKEETEIEFPVSAKIQNITINVETKVKTMTNGDQLQTSSHTISFASHQNEQNFCIQNLRYTTSGYEIYLLGQNGEPKPNININIDFYVRGYNGLIQTQLTTNSEGFVKLYELENVLSIQSTIEPQGDISAEQKIWVIGNSNQINYKNTVEITQNDSIRLPYLRNKLDSNLNFLSTLSLPDSEKITIISDEIARVKVDNQAIIIDPLPIGDYKLLIRDIGEVINISVIEGTYWKNSHNIQTEKGLIDQKRNAHILFIENVQIETPQDSTSGNTLKIKLYSDHQELVRAHVIAYHYLPGDLNKIIDNLNEIQIEQDSNFINTSKAQKGNSYQSNKTIGDEVRYAIERKRHQRYIGNTLDKPHLLLKRTFMRDTAYETESVSSGAGYQARQPSINQDPNIDDLLHRKPVARNRMEKNLRRSPQSYNFQPPQSYDYQIVDCFNNFLLNPALVISNLKPDENGFIVVKNLNLSKYSTVQVIATDLYNNITKVIPLDKNVIEKRNLCQRVNAQKEKFFTISRTNEFIQKSDEFKSQDFTSTELQLIDSIPKLFAAQKELRKIAGNDTEQINGYDFWDFLPKWQGYSLEEKHKKYDKFSCHELNLFIFCKDPPFFNDFVKPFILNKIEKTFIDRFLIDDTEYLLKTSTANQIAELNALEMVLLIFFLKKSNKIEDAKCIFNFLESSNKIKKYDTQQFKKLFDTVLNAKTEDETEDPFAYIVAANTQSQALANYNIMPQMMNQQQQAYPQMYNNNNISPYPMGGMGGGLFGAALPQQAFAPPPVARYAQPMMMQQQQQFQQINMQVQNQGGAFGFGFGGGRQQLENFANLDDFGGNDFGQKYEKKRGGFVQQYQNLDTTKEYCERHYYSQKDLTPQTHLVPVNNYWVDLARHIINYGQEKPFLSSNFIYCSSNHTQMIASLSFLALSFESQSHNYEPYEGKGIKITMSSNCIVFAKQIKEGQAQLREDILITQKFFDPNDRYVFSDENPDDKYEKQIKEYIVDKRYGCQVIVTNCSAARHELQVFVEIPSGSIPVCTTDYTKTHNIVLEPFQTKPIEYFFYFPQSGKEEIYPCNVAKSGQIVAFAKPTIFDVKEKRTISNLETMNEILQKGSKEDILTFISTKNILNTNIFQFTEVFYLLRDHQFYKKFIEILKNRRIFDVTAWSYSIYHGDFPTFIELIQNKQVSKQLEFYINYFDSSQLQLDTHRFYEYYPLSNPRVHMLHSDKSNILNKEFKERYNNFLSYLIQKPKWTVSDRLGIVYYFLLQDRIEEAIQIFKQIEPSQVASSPNCQLQYDYFTSYLDLFIGFPNFKKARELCEKYLDYPVFQWRNLFYEVANKLAEYDGEEEHTEDASTEQSEEETKQQKLKKANKKKEEMNELLKAELTQAKLDITIQNIAQLTINYYLIDLEILFSRNPFLSKDNSDFSFVKPNHSDVFNYDVSQGIQKVEIQIPQKYHKSNVCIELSSPNTSRSLTYFSTSLQVQVIEEIGQIKVQDKEDKPLSKVYVKCFSKKNDGTVSFYKDGYTDLVGRFDYTSRNSSNVSNVNTFSIFIMSDELGAIIKEANPPSQVGQIVEEVKLKGTNWNQRAETRNKSQNASYANHQVQQKSCMNAFY